MVDQFLLYQVSASTATSCDLSESNRGPSGLQPDALAKTELRPHLTFVPSQEVSPGLPHRKLVPSDLLVVIVLRTWPSPQQRGLPGPCPSSTPCRSDESRCFPSSLKLASALLVRPSVLSVRLVDLPEKRHACLFRSPVVFLVVARRAGGDAVHP